MDKIEIVIAGEEDIAGINQVNKEHRKAKPLFLVPADIDDKFYVLQSDNRVMLVAKKRNEIIGYLELYCNTSTFFDSYNEAECNIVVNPNYRRLKIREKLLRYAIQYTENETKLKKMKARIKKGNMASKSLCENGSYATLGIGGFLWNVHLILKYLNQLQMINCFFHHT